jgi:DNA-binding transcriptional LysR family regulator
MTAAFGPENSRAGNQCRAKIRPSSGSGPSIEFTTTNAPAALLDDGLDLVLRVGQIPDSSFVARQLGSAALLTCAAPAYLARVGKPSRPRDLAGHRAIIPGRRDETSFAQWRFSATEWKMSLSTFRSASLCAMA